MTRHSHLCATFETSRELQTSSFPGPGRSSPHAGIFIWYRRGALSLSISLFLSFSLSLSLSISTTISVVIDRYNISLSKKMWIYLLHIDVNIKFCVCHRITSTPMNMTVLRRVVKSWYESHCLYPSICVVGTLYPVHHTLRSRLSVIRHSCVCTSREMQTRMIAPPSWHCNLIWRRCSLSLSLSLFLSSSMDFFVTCVDISSPFRWHMQSRHI
jgi:hypothetical protein